MCSNYTKQYNFYHSFPHSGQIVEVEVGSARRISESMKEA